MTKPIDINGERFGKLLVIEKTDNRWKHGTVLWKCVCDCGGVIETSSYHLRSGHTTSCGCVGYQKRNNSVTKHGMCGTSTYSTYRGMLKRCYNKNTDSYKHYGGRGIVVCRRWRKSFESFYKDTGDKPSKYHTLERVDNDGPYGPWNCIWGTREEQGKNKRTNIWLTYEGERRILNDLAKEFNMDHGTLKQRIKKGWSVAKACHEPIQKIPKYKFDGEMLDIAEISRRIGMNYNTLKGRLGTLGWSLEKATSTPIKTAHRNTKAK